MMFPYSKLKKEFNKQKFELNLKSYFALTISKTLAVFFLNFLIFCCWLASFIVVSVLDAQNIIKSSSQSHQNLDILLGSLFGMTILSLTFWIWSLKLHLKNKKIAKTFLQNKEISSDTLNAYFYWFSWTAKTIFSPITIKEELKRFKQKILDESGLFARQETPAVFNLWMFGFDFFFSCSFVGIAFGIILLLLGVLFFSIPIGFTQMFYRLRFFRIKDNQFVFLNFRQITDEFCSFLIAKKLENDQKFLLPSPSNQ